MDRIGEAMRATQHGWEAIKPHARSLRRGLPAQQKALVEELRAAGYHDIAHGYKMDTFFEQQGASAGFVSQIIKLHYPLLAARHGWGQAAKALKVVYHGTADFNVFSHDGAPTSRHPSRKLGFVFTESAEEAGRPDFWYPVTQIKPRAIGATGPSLRRARRSSSSPPQCRVRSSSGARGARASCSSASSSSSLWASP